MGLLDQINDIAKGLGGQKGVNQGLLEGVADLFKGGRAPQSRGQFHGQRPRGHHQVVGKHREQ